jgi:hypothetical protein
VVVERTAGTQVLGVRLETVRIAASPPSWYSHRGYRSGWGNAGIPPFNDDGYLPPGIDPATLEEIAVRFGTESELRQVQRNRCAGSSIWLGAPALSGWL